MPAWYRISSQLSYAGFMPELSGGSYHSDHNFFLREASTLE
jgi:hypothetical protein